VYLRILKHIDYRPAQKTINTFNPSPHCFIAITNLTASGGKKPLLPHLLHSTEGERGKIVLSQQALKICLVKT
jgi:hypothetical protein